MHTDGSQLIADETFDNGRMDKLRICTDAYNY